MNNDNYTKLNNPISGLYNLPINSIMKVQKRNARGYEAVSFDKITIRIRHLTNGLNPIIDPTRVALSTIKSIYDGITTEELDNISANIAESNKLIHPDYSKLAARILISNLHKTTPRTFSACMKNIGDNLDIKSEKHYNFIAKYANELDNMINDANDYNFDYLGYKTLEKSYLNKIPEIVTGADGKPVYIDRNNNVVPSERVTMSKRNQPIFRNDSGVIERLHHKIIERVVDRPQYMFMRVAIAVNIDSDSDTGVMLGNIKLCYKALSTLLISHATPTLFNACCKVQQLNSCFLLGTEDSIEGINENLSNASVISKWAGGIGIHMHNIRCRNSRINGTNGKSSGLPKQLKIYNEAALCWDQGGKRKGAFAIYLEPWHGDILKFLELKLQQGSESERARDLFYALWVSDLFIKRWNDNGDWSLFSEDTAPGLSDVYDGMSVCTKCNYCENVDYIRFTEKYNAQIEQKYDHSKWSDCNHTFETKDVFTELYEEYEEDGRAIKVIKAAEIVDAMCAMQRESGTPYVCFKDHVNRMSNQQNIGTIKSSNLCAEIMEWSSSKSYACCTLASINIKKFITSTITNGTVKYSVNHEHLHEVVRLLARNLDIIIDMNKYPVAQCESNSMDYRPIGIGIQGLADLFAMMRLPFLSEEAARVDIEIFETMYHAMITESCNRAQKYGKYSKFDGSPASKGMLQPDLWEMNQKRIHSPVKAAKIKSGRYDWDVLKQLVMKFGLRNSLGIALMPTVSTAQIMGNNESFEPFSNNVYTKTTLGGKFTLTNNIMIEHLIQLGLWNDELKNRIINNDGSISEIEEIPADVRELYKTVWELKQTELMKRAAIRGAYVDQSQSLNIYLRDNSNSVLKGVLKFGHSIGLKTGNYYIRTRPAAKAMKNNIAATKQAEIKKEEANKEIKKEEPEYDGEVCTMSEGCISCSG
ncbi:Ribonucleotide reductase large subunit (alpha) [Pacmanvirus A23]|uniref:ribonucleotide reductase n=1 Tax=Pacmanvirus A23 TaxID=1932881 RepID=UPI000A094C95|nr:ribonucleotide reductase [Pacmanvirus A23]SIP85779.1 Ribonucleotide reductase large subunit (alpha) [Pacmanvirus A23]